MHSQTRVLPSADPQKLAHASTLRSTFAFVLLVGGASILSLGCAGADGHGPPLANEDAEAPHVNTSAGCGTETGCTCANPGEVIDCRAYRKSGDYVACSPGVRACGDDGRWGECIGDTIAK